MPGASRWTRRPGDPKHHHDDGGRRGEEDGVDAAVRPDGRLLPAHLGWPDRASAAVSGGLLLVAGLVGGTAVVVHHRAVRSRATEPDLAGG